VGIRKSFKPLLSQHEALVLLLALREGRLRPGRPFPRLGKFVILVTFTFLGYRVGRQTPRVRDENERAGSKVVPRSPPTRGKGLGAALENPATMTVLTAVLAALTFVLVVLTAWLVVLATVQKPRVARPAYRWA
jgi:hypothetical protein